MYCKKSINIYMNGEGDTKKLTFQNLEKILKNHPNLKKLEFNFHLRSNA